MKSYIPTINISSLIKNNFNTKKANQTIKQIEKACINVGFFQITGHGINLKEIKNKMKEYQRFIKNNFDYVGNNFAYEARSIHYNEKKNKKGIYGTATKTEFKELKEEGVEAEIIPWVEDKSN